MAITFSSLATGRRYCQDLQVMHPAFSTRRHWRRYFSQSEECDRFDEARMFTGATPRLDGRRARRERREAVLAQARLTVGNVRMHDEHDPEL